MPFALNDGVRIFWRVDGAADKPSVLLLNSIGSDMSLWDSALPYLLPHLRVLRMDTRGHGASDAPDGDYDMETLACDALAVMDAAGVNACAVGGISLGGMIAMSVALKAPERVVALIPACTSADMDKAIWQTRIDLVRGQGMASIAATAIARFFSEDFRRNRPEITQSVEAGLRSTSPVGYSGCGAAIRDMELLGRLGAITAPTLVIAGSKDVATPFEGHGDRIAAAIPGAQTVIVDASHLASLEAPSAVASAIVSFLKGDRSLDAASQALFEAGLKTRRHVLGDAWVDKSLARRTPFNSDFQAMITRIAWHEIWNRPGLDHRTRRLLVVGICASLGRWEEFALHVRAGLDQGGFTQDQLKEALMQTAIYAGVPAANTAFAEAGKIIAELESVPDHKA